MCHNVIILTQYKIKHKLYVKLYIRKRALSAFLYSYVYVVVNKILKIQTKPLSMAETVTTRPCVPAQERCWCQPIERAGGVVVARTRCVVTRGCTQAAR